MRERAAAAADAKSAAAGEKDAARNAATTVPGESAGPLVDAAALDLEVIEAEDSEVTQDDDVLGGDDAGVVDFDPEEEEEEEEDKEGQLKRKRDDE